MDVLNLTVNDILLFSEVSKEISVDVTDIDEEKRKRLREVEIKVAKFTDKLESSGKETPSSIKEKVAQYRQQLLEVSWKIINSRLTSLRVYGRFLFLH